MNPFDSDFWFKSQICADCLHYQVWSTQLCGSSDCELKKLETLTKQEWG